MSNSSLAIHTGREARRSTRVKQAIRLAVVGVDSYRGPYHEEVSTVTVNCHGCMYESKYAVSPNSFVMLELNGKGRDSERISRRGHVKWTQQPAVRGGLFQTAIEFNTPGNIWAIDSPPSDWLPFCGPRSPEADESNAKAVAVLRPESAPTTTKEQSGKANARAAESASPPSFGMRPVGQPVGDPHQELETMRYEGAEAIVRERATVLLSNMRAGLREEAKRIVAISSQAGSWIDESLKHMHQIGEESARARHAKWTKKIETDLQQALTQMEMRHRELEEASERLMTKTQYQLQRFLEASREDAVSRIIARLKEQLAPLIDCAQKAAAELTKREEELEKICQYYVEKSAAQIEESCTQLDKQFEMIVRERLDSAREELDRAASAAATSALNGIRTSAQNEAEAQGRLVR